MKKLIIVLVILLGFNMSYSQIEMKGFQLGEFYDGPEENTTTLGGIKGVLSVGTISDGRAYMLYFSPSNDGKKPSRINNSDVERLKIGIERKYGVVFERISKNSYSSDDYFLYAEKDGVAYSMSVNYNQFSTPTTEMIFFVDNEDLVKIYEKEEQRKANNDF